MKFSNISFACFWHVISLLWILISKMLKQSFAIHSQIGTTSSTAVDPLPALGKITKVKPGKRGLTSWGENLLGGIIYLAYRRRKEVWPFLKLGLAIGYFSLLCFIRSQFLDGQTKKFNLFHLDRFDCWVFQCWDLGFSLWL